MENSHRHKTNLRLRGVILSHCEQFDPILSENLP